MIVIATAVSLVGILVFSPINNAIAAITDSPQSQCPEGSQIQHWDKIIFVVKSDSSRVLGPNSVGKQFDLIVPSQPGVVYDLESVVLTAIENQINPTHDPHIVHKAVRIEITDVKYDAATCGTTTQGPQGIQGPPGPSGTISAQSCPPNQFTTGFDSSGKMICSAIPLNHPPIVNAGQDQSSCIDSTITLAGTVSDDGLPIGGILTHSWSQVSGPSMTFSDPNSLTSDVSVSNTGEYVLRLTASDSYLSSSDDMTIAVHCAG